MHSSWALPGGECAHNASAAIPATALYAHLPIMHACTAVSSPNCNSELAHTVPWTGQSYKVVPECCAVTEGMIETALVRCPFKGRRMLCIYVDPLKAHRPTQYTEANEHGLRFDSRVPQGRCVKTCPQCPAAPLRLILSTQNVHLLFRKRPINTVGDRKTI